MKANAKRIVDRFPHLRDSAERQQMLVRNAVGSARVEGIQANTDQLQQFISKCATPAPKAKRSE
ncbi:hypothetical protein E5K00_01690 [Hymenobacter aquaticus]|uniref:Uncharacterized protein n=1 Tax=Hymenobacter aquaticus TaxID=1867101 RepID=A0A4Z0Q4A2_9BACT|nr:hypothetical protein [Hymenobacter aquaticus]TGE23953.1 hypothetical protein E5K00_01690 [Hymenobacter aquaticus]